MITSFFKRYVRLLVGVCSVLTTWAAFTITSCRREPDDSSGTTLSSAIDRSGCKVYLSYDVETTTYKRPLNMADTTLLSPGDHIMGFPQREKYHVEACYKPDGSKKVEMTVMNATPVIPVTVGTSAYHPPLSYNKLTVTNESAVFTKTDGSVVNTYSKNTAATTEALLTSLSDINSVTNAEVERVLLLMEQNGLKIKRHQNDIVTILREDPAGNSVQILDKAKRMYVGRVHYNAQGEEIQRFLMDAEGIAPNVVIKRTSMAAQMKSLDGTIPMVLYQDSQFTNFTFTLNN